MAINFPNSPSNGTFFQSGKAYYKYTGGVWMAWPWGTALPHNYLVNPSFQVSQQNGDNAGSASGFYPADQWTVSYSLVTGRPNVWRLPAVTPNGGAHRLHMGIGTAQASLDIYEWLGIVQILEGNRVGSLGWGDSTARKRVVLRFGCVAKAGTYSVTLRNGNTAVGTKPSYTIPFTITPIQTDTFTMWEFAIPAPTIGTWLTGTDPALELWFTVACGTGLIAPTPLTWVDGSYIGATGQSNLASTTANHFQIFDVGLYIDPDNTQKAPPYVLPNIRVVTQECQRYWCKVLHGRGNSVTATVAARVGSPFPVPMRIAPACAAVGNVYVWDAYGMPPVTSMGVYANTDVFEGDLTCAAGGLGPGRTCSIPNTDANNYIAASARM